MLVSHLSIFLFFDYDVIEVNSKPVRFEKATKVTFTRNVLRVFVYWRRYLI